MRLLKHPTKSSIIKALACALTLAASLPLSAQAFTGLFGDSTGVSFSGEQNELQVNQGNWFSAGMKIPLSSNAASYLAAQASGTFSLDYLSDGSLNTDLKADLDLLKLNTVFKNKKNETLTLAGGRFAFSDVTGFIFAQPADGAIVQIRTQKFSTAASVSYTGLLNAKSVNMSDNEGNKALDGTDFGFYQFAAPYAALSLSYSMPYLFSNQTLGVEALGIVAMPGIGDSFSETPNFNRAYATVFLNGPVASFIFYDFTTTFGYSTKNPGVTNLSTASLNIYPKFLGSAFGLSAVYASGENGFLKPFVGFTRTNAVPANETIGYSGITKLGATASIKPSYKFYLGAEGYALFNNAGASFSYGGVEAGLTAIYQLFTDVQFKLDAETFIAEPSHPELNKTSIKLNAVISF